MTTCLPGVEEIAAQIVERAGARVAPLDLRAVAGLWPQLRVTEADLDGDGYLLDLGRIGGEILVRRDHPITRRRFSIAHELGHWILLREHGATANPREWSSHVELERWCDRFAAALLMPEPWLQRDVPGGVSPETIQRLAQRYGVSARAARLRITEATPVSIAEVSAHAGLTRIARFDPSKRAKAPPRESLLKAVAAWPDDPPASTFLLSTRLVFQRGRTRRWLVMARPRPERTPDRRTRSAVGENLAYQRS